MVEKNGRKSDRAAVQYVAGFRRVGEEIYETAVIDNLSPGGFFVTTPSNFIVGDELDVKIRFGNGLVLEKTQAKVKHVRQGEGIGAEFSIPHPELRGFLKMVVELRASAQ